MGEPGNSVGDTFGSGVAGPHTVTTIVVHGWAQIPAVDSMRGPGATNLGFFMDEDLYARRGHGGAVEVKETKDMGVGGKMGMKTAGAEQIKGLEGLG
jgi:hypothetical protein